MVAAILAVILQREGKEHSGDAVRKSRQLSAAGSFTGRNLRVYNIELKLASNSPFCLSFPHAGVTGVH